MAKKKFQEELIHIRFDQDELVEFKKRILSVEVSLLKILRIIRSYSILRDEELKKKIVLKEQMANFNKFLGKLKTELPKLKIPKILKRDETELEDRDEEGPLNKPIVDKRYDSDLDFELQKIQNELKKLQ